MNIGFKDIPRQIETTFNKLFIALEGAIFMLDANDVVIADGCECGNELSPVHDGERDAARSVRSAVFLDRVLFFRLRDGDLELGSNLGDRLAHRAELCLIAAPPRRNE